MKRGLPVEVFARDCSVFVGLGHEGMRVALGHVGHVLRRRVVVVLSLTSFVAVPSSRDAVASPRR